MQRKIVPICVRSQNLHLWIKRILVFCKIYAYGPHKQAEVLIHPVITGTKFSLANGVEILTSMDFCNSTYTENIEKIHCFTFCKKFKLTVVLSSNIFPAVGDLMLLYIDPNLQFLKINST